MRQINLYRRAALLAIATLMLTTPALADDVRIDDPWTRATAPGQKVAGGFMRLTADADMTLVGGSSPVSAHFELHTMRMDDGVMVMREVENIPLPKGKTVELKPGGLHIMFIGLRQPIRAGDRVPVTLRLRGADGKERMLEIEAEARAPGGMPPRPAH
jgi:periplasmic copper chaperone A